MYSDKYLLNKSKLGYFVSLFGCSFILLWLGIFKFTPTEANAIIPLIENHPLSFWMYRLFKIQTVSNIIGSIEILIAILIFLSLKFSKLRKYAGISICIIFMTTLSFLFTTPLIWKNIDGVPHPDFFILKDILFLGFGITLSQSSKKIF